MNSRELVSNALRGLPVPRVPVGPLAVHYCARFGGCTLRRYSTDAAALAESVIRYYERFRPDAVWLSADTWVNAEAMGVRVGASGDDQPLGGVGPPLVEAAGDIDRIPPPDVGWQGRYPMMLEALSRIVAAVGKDAFVVGCFDQYPFSLAAALMGINEIMLKVIDDPPFVDALMERCAEYTIAYGSALAGAGADMLSGGDSPASLVGPELYERFAMPLERRVIGELRRRTKRPVSLHICGKALPLLAQMKEAGADVLELEVDITEACASVGPEIALWGNLDPVHTLQEGTRERVLREAVEVLAAVRRRGHSRFVLSSGCTLAVDTPDENIEAMMEAARLGGGNRV